MALPQIAAIAALAVGSYHVFKSPSRNLVEDVQGVCNEKYCPPTYLIHVDKASNTLMRDDRPAAKGTVSSQLAAAYKLTKHTYEQEALNHPGVNLVAHAIS